MDLAYFYQRQGLWGKAEQGFLQALRLNPRDLDAATALARLYERQGQCRKAKQRYLEALRIDPQAIDIHLGLAYCYHKEGLVRQASEEIRKALQIMPCLSMPREQKWRKERASVIGRYIEEASRRSMRLP